MSKSFTFNAKTIDGMIQTFAVPFTLECNKVIPVGFQVMRGFDENNCVIATKVFLVQYGGKTLGSNDFTTTEQFLSFLDGVCGCCNDQANCYIKVNGCYLTVDGCRVLI